MNLLESINNFLSRCARLIYSSAKYYVFENDLTNVKEVAPSKLKIENSLATLNEVDELVNLRPTNNRKSISKFLNKGDLCFYSRFASKFFFAIIRSLWLSISAQSKPFIL